nr:unnamed protein product [Callosobruchus analis]
METSLEDANLSVENKEPAPVEKKENADNTMTSDHSEYDSADSYSDEENAKDLKVRSRSSDPGNHSHSESGGSISLEREEGDGQESAPQKKVDDDEDKKNPQYIPKRGTFYEHDDRTLDEEGEAQVAETDKDGKKKVWQDKKEKWSHDRFNESEQAPKSKAELINIYGYDIRNEEGPPRARRRRRYGRGPNKYTRNWEDEEAYNSKPAPKAKITTKKQSRPNKNIEDFPPLITTDTEDVLQASQPLDDHPEERRDSIEREHFQIPATAAKSPDRMNRSRNDPQDTHLERSGQRAVSDRQMKPKKEIKDSDYRGFTTKTRQQRPVKTEQQKVLPRNQQQAKPDFIQTQNYTNKARDSTPQSIQDMEKELSKLTVDGVYKGGNKQGAQRQGSVPPRLQSEHTKGSKRYSSMRQRSLPEANTPPAGAYPTTFYPNEYNGQSQQPLPPTALPPPPAAPLIPAQYPPAGFPPGTAPPPFVAAPPQFITPPPQQPQIINFVQAAAAAGQPPFAPPNFQGYQQQFTPVTQPPAELFQPQGITYYSADQQVGQRPAPQKRPKAAIPIVAPPEQKKDEIDESQTNDSGTFSETTLEAKQ